jgi:hypothetical protein
MTTAALSWRERNAWIADLLKRRTGDDVAAWNARVAAQDLSDETSLRSWLTEQGVTGYPQMMLVMERFGYPDFLTASSDDLIEGQYADRPDLRPILDAVLARTSALGDVTIQARKGYVSLLTPRRTFATVEPTTKKRVDIGLRLADHAPGGRLESGTSLGQSAMNLRIALASVDDVDDEVEDWLRRAWEANS